MIKVIANNNEIIVKGHADYAEHGRDIVCSAVSALTQSTLLGLIKYSKVEHTKVAGFVNIKVINRTDITDAITNIFTMAIREIEENYPDYVQLNKEEL